LFGPSAAIAQLTAHTQANPRTLPNFLDLFSPLPGVYVAARWRAPW
jgi:hypothetical protein